MALYIDLFIYNKNRSIIIYSVIQSHPLTQSDLRLSTLPHSSAAHEARIRQHLTQQQSRRRYRATRLRDDDDVSSRVSSISIPQVSCHP